MVPSLPPLPADAETCGCSERYPLRYLWRVGCWMGLNRFTLGAPASAVQKKAVGLSPRRLTCADNPSPSFQGGTARRWWTAVGTSPAGTAGAARWPATPSTATSADARRCVPWAWWERRAPLIFLNFGLEKWGCLIHGGVLYMEKYGYACYRLLPPRRRLHLPTLGGRKAE